jgi:hypothetical protein
MNKEFKRDGYVYERLGGTAINGCLQGETFMFVLDDWGKILHKFHKKFSKSMSGKGGYFHYNINLNIGGNYDVVCAIFDETPSIRRQQLVELETYIGGMDKCIVCADAKISKWHEPPLIVPTGYLDVWREYGKPSNEFNLGVDRYDRIWLSNTQYVTCNMYDVLESSSDRKPILVEID